MTRTNASRSTRVLRASAFDVRTYVSAEDYLSSSGAEPLCVLLDMQLGGMSGLEFLRDFGPAVRRCPSSS